MRRTKEIQIWPGRVIEQGLKPVSLREWVGIMELVSAASWGLGHSRWPIQYTGA